MTEAEEIQEKLKSGLVLWAAAHDVRPVDFALKMKYAYSHAWSLLCGKLAFTPEALGRFVLGYGLENTAQLLKMAALPYGVTVEALAGPEDAAIVPVVKSRVNNVGRSKKDGRVSVSSFSKN